jgi:hypothetical protein
MAKCGDTSYSKDDKVNVVIKSHIININYENYWGS